MIYYTMEIVDRFIYKVLWVLIEFVYVDLLNFYD